MVHEKIDKSCALSSTDGGDADKPRTPQIPPGDIRATDVPDVPLRGQSRIVLRIVSVCSGAIFLSDVPPWLPRKERKDGGLALLFMPVGDPGNSRLGADLVLVAPRSAANANRTDDIFS